MLENKNKLKNYMFLLDYNFYLRLSEKIKRFIFNFHSNLSRNTNHNNLSFILNFVKI
jgi:hypothetical protein